MTPEELIEQVSSSAFVSDTLCKEALGDSKISINAARRYAELAVRLGSTVSVLLDIQYYSEKYPDIELVGVDSFLHFFTWGYAEGRSPHPLIEPRHINSIDDHLLAIGCGIQDLCDVLCDNLVDPSPYFLLDSYRAYLSTAEDTSEGLLVHFLTLKRGFKPNPPFDPIWYATHQVGEPTDAFSALALLQ